MISHVSSLTSLCIFTILLSIHLNSWIINSECLLLLNAEERWNILAYLFLSWILAPGRGREERKRGGGEGRYFYPNNLNMTVLSPSNEQQQLYFFSTLNLYDTTNIYITQKMKRVQAVHNNHWGIKRYCSLT